jgi:hypothetical protein
MDADLLQVLPAGRDRRLAARLKEWRAVANWYEKTATSFLGVLHLAAAIDWLRRQRALAREF